MITKVKLYTDRGHTIEVRYNAHTKEFIVKEHVNNRMLDNRIAVTIKESMNRLMPKMQADKEAERKEQKCHKDTNLPVSSQLESS